MTRYFWPSSSGSRGTTRIALSVPPSRLTTSARNLGCTRGVSSPWPNGSAVTILVGLVFGSASGAEATAGPTLSGTRKTDALANTDAGFRDPRSEEHTSELQSRPHLVCRLLLEKKKKKIKPKNNIKIEIT